jgi:diguanylate cyclase (GGDEF)-like protein
MVARTFLSPWTWSGRKLAFFLFLLTFFTVLSYGGALLEVFSWLNDERQVRIFDRVVRGIDRIDSDIGQIRLGRSGYLVSGQRAYLVAYTSGIETLFRDTERLRRILLQSGGVSGEAVFDALSRHEAAILLPLARTLEERGLMETRVHFRKTDRAGGLADSARYLADLRTRYHRIGEFEKTRARLHLLGTSGLFGMSFVLFSVFLGVTATRITKDISSVNRLVSHLYHDARHDPLTGLPNRAAVLDALEGFLSGLFSGKERLALLYIDLDHFKEVNDRLGHEQGDMALRLVSERFLGAIREDDILARLGGDEFLLLLRSIGDGKTPERIADRLIRSMADPFLLGGRQATMGVSIGIAVFPDHGTDASYLLKQADEAMYRSKTAGGNAFHVADLLPGPSSDLPTPAAGTNPSCPFEKA